MEKSRPFTLNHKDYCTSREEFVTEFAHRRAKSYGEFKPASSSTHTIKDVYGTSHSVSAKGVGEDVLLSLLTANGYRISDSKQLARLHDPDDYDTELEVIAQVLSYFEISSKRIIDIMPMIFETVFARDFGGELRKELTSNLKLVGESGYETCGRYATEEQEVQRRREELDGEKGILSSAVTVVSRFYK
jgi:hypothetical protein